MKQFRVYTFFYISTDGNLILIRNMKPILSSVVFKDVCSHKSHRSSQTEKGVGRIQVGTKALHSPRQTTIILSTPTLCSADTLVVLTKLTYYEVQVRYSVESRMSKTIYYLLSVKMLFILKCYYSNYLIVHNMPCKITKIIFFSMKFS